VKYVSTRGEAPVLGFEDVLLTGLARDGGLYVPETWPRLTPAEIAGMAASSYEDVALRVMRPFIGGEIPEAELAAMIGEAYASFSHRAVAPLVQTAPNQWILELFHGPTLAFKDVAMQVLARLMDRTLARRGKRATIVGATSGDTGGAAIEAFRGRNAIDVFILFPHGRVSDVQRRQMTTPEESNVHAIAIDGTFDDCQNIIKAMFNNLGLRDELQLAGVNSINWARLMAQVVYYFSAGAALGAPARRLAFAVPTGNFGDVFAGHVAARMGLAVDRLVVATNVNDILARTVATGRYSPLGVTATSSPSMDIQISSNFERLLLELAGGDTKRVRSHMSSLGQGGFTLDANEHQSLRRNFSAARVDEAETLDEIRRLYRETKYIADPHTAVGIAGARKLIGVPGGIDPAVPTVMLATAHPAKFPDAVAKAIGHPPPPPPVIEAQRSKTERISRLPADVSVIARFVKERSRVGRPA
jgi:threonine synthase